MIGVLASGEGTNLQALLDDGLPVVAVASNREDARALERADRAGIATAAFELEDFPSRDDRDAAMADWLAARGVELVVCAGYMHLLTEPFLARFPDRIVNVHPALLPRFPGTHPIADALAAGVRETGATVHYVDAGIDTGPVIRQESVAVEPRDTVETLRARIQVVEHRLLPQVVRELIPSHAWPASAPAGQSPAPPPPEAADGTVPSRPVPSTVPSGPAPSAASQACEGEA